MGDFFAKDSETLEEVGITRMGEHLIAHHVTQRSSIEHLATAEWSSWEDAPWLEPGFALPTPPAEPRMYEEFRHYKGGIYKVFSLAWDTRYGHWAVVYVSAKGNWWLRPHSMWSEQVDVGGGNVPRFARLF